jgi:predicted membrane channel-forming protein YqfA (hemolysin III family)
LRPSGKNFNNNGILVVAFVFAGFSVLPGFLYLHFFVDEALVHNVDGVIGVYLQVGAVYIFGAVLYAFRFPESRWPRKFDYIGNSH